MLFTDKSSGKAFAKDPAVAYFDGKYFMYYSTIETSDGKDKFKIGIATSSNADDWNIVGYVPMEKDYERNGIAAPGVIVLQNTIHLFYQTYGNREKDAICHAYSVDGVNFVKDEKNPVFSPSNDWCCGRAIDADVCLFNGKLFMYVATRDHGYEIQKIAGAYAKLDGNSFSEFTQICKASIISPELIWEGKCTEAPALIVNNERLYMFYGGAYNCSPQQIGCAVSADGRTFDKLFINEPFIKCGDKGSWNESESGHPFAFRDIDGTAWLYHQGSNDNGNTWYLTRTEIDFDSNNLPILVNKNLN